MELLISDVSQMRRDARDKMCSCHHVAHKHLPPQTLEGIVQSHVCIQKAIKSPLQTKKGRGFPCVPLKMTKNSVSVVASRVRPQEGGEADGGGLLRIYVNELVHMAFKCVGHEMEERVTREHLSGNIFGMGNKKLSLPFYVHFCPTCI